MIKPLLHDDTFLADVRHAHHGHGQFHLWWLGQSGFLVQWAAKQKLQNLVAGVQKVQRELGI